MAERVDRLGLSLLLIALCTVFFLLILRRALPAFFAGTALSALMIPPLLRLEKKNREKRNARWAKSAFAEAAVDDLLLTSAPQAAFQAAQWLKSAYHLDSVLGYDNECVVEKGEKKWAVFFLQKHATGEGSCDDMLVFLRRARAIGIESVLILSACPFSAAARKYSQGCKLSVRLFDRSETVGLCAKVLPKRKPSEGFYRKSRSANAFFTAFARHAFSRKNTFRFILLTTGAIWFFVRSLRFLYLVFAVLGLFSLFFCLRKPKDHSPNEL